MGNFVIIIIILAEAYASFAEFPWTLIIYEKDESGAKPLICGAALLSPNFALTSAHCVYG